MNMEPLDSSSAPGELLRKAQSAVHPGKATKDRVRSRMQARMAAPTFLEQARESLVPHRTFQQKVWARISSSFSPLQPSLWDSVRDSLSPDGDVSLTLWQRIQMRLQPSYVHVLVSRPIKLVAAFSILLFVVRVSPFLFLAQPTGAVASVQVVPTRGQVEMLIGGLWQQVENEITLYKPTTLRTQEGEATIILYDDAVIRMAAHSTLSLNDFSDRPAEPDTVPDVSLQNGSLWVLGLIPRHLEGLAIGTVQGRVVVHEGSTSITQNGSNADVQVWYRSASVLRRGKQMFLVAGEKVKLQKDNIPLITKSDIADTDTAWATNNIAKDAVHQREIAQMQQERHAASAGILPDSGLYPAKRLAEAVDMLFTFGSEARAKKMITNANTRLNEAAALIKQGNEEEAKQPLREYKETLLAIASGSGSNATVQSLLEKEVVREATADVAAALPDDPSYVLKQTIRDTIAALPVDKPDTESADILDQLSAAKRHADEGEMQTAKVELEKLKSALPIVISGEGTPIQTDVQREVEATITSLAAAIEPKDDAKDAEVLPEDISLAERRALRVSAGTVLAPIALTDSEMDSMVRQMENRITKGVTSIQARKEQLRIELHRIEGHPDQGKILRKLYRALSDTSLAEYIKAEMHKVSENKASGTGSVE
jgi:soluble cytochrome b562